MLRVGNTTNFNVTNTEDAAAIAQYGQGTYWTGLISGGAVTRGAGLVLNVAAGTGYVNDGPRPEPISWGATAVTLGSMKANEYVYVTADGVVLHSESVPVYASNIILARAVTDATDVVLLTRDEIGLGHAMARIAAYLEGTIGPLMESGAAVLAHATPLAVTVVGGKFWVGLSERIVAGGAAVTFTGWYRDGSGGWTAVPGMLLIDDEQWDDGSGVLAAITAGQYTNHTVFIAVHDGGEEYHVVYGQAEFASAADARSGNLPTSPTVLKEYCLRSAAIIVQKAAGAIDSIVDVRTQVGQHAAVDGGVAGNHDLLINLEHDTHMQYQTTARADAWHALLAGAHVAGGDAHDHVGGAGAQIDHTTLSSIGTKTHAALEAQVNAHVADVTAAHGATAVPTASKVVIADAGARVDGWVTSGAGAATPSLRALGTGATEACAGNDARLIFGNDYQVAVAAARTTNDTDLFVTKVALTTPALTGTYRVRWDAVVDNNLSGSNMEIRLYDATGAAVVGTVRSFRPSASSERRSEGGVANVVFVGVAKTFQVQFRATTESGIAGCADAQIEVWRIA